MKVGDILICKKEPFYRGRTVEKFIKGQSWKIINIVSGSSGTFFTINLIDSIYSYVFYEKELLRFFYTPSQIRKQKLLKIENYGIKM